MATYIRKCAPSPQATALFVTPLVAGNVHSIQKGSHPVILDQEGRPHKGLKACVRIEEPHRPPIYVIDNHSLAFYAWHEALAMGYILPGATLLHIDYHDDYDGDYPGELPPRAGALREIAAFTQRDLTVANFIFPAVANGLVRFLWDCRLSPDKLPSDASLCSLEYLPPKVKRALQGKGYFERQRILLKLLDQNKGLEVLPLREVLRRKVPPRKFILDIDLDALVRGAYSGPLPRPEEFAQAAQFLAEIAKRAGVVTIATSPGYADQRIAIRVAKQIVREILKKSPLQGEIRQKQRR